MESSACAGTCQVLASYFSRDPHPYLSSICVSTAAGDTASRVNDEQRDRWLLLSSGVMAPSLLSVTEPKLTDRQMDGQTCRQKGWQPLSELYADNDLCNMTYPFLVMFQFVFTSVVW